MTFNSFEFLFFAPLIFIIYWLIPKQKFRIQNVLLLAASYFFYGFWDWRFLGLIIFSSIVDFCIGIGLGNTTDKTKRKILLWTSIITNIGLLGVFKYFDFFSESFSQLASNIGFNTSPFLLNVLLPVGISFYTFQTLSYTIDVYRKKMEPSKDVIAFFTFVAFFPQLVAGPIERAKQLLPQFLKERSFSYEKAKLGLRQIFWGIFKKAVIADGLAEYVNVIFANYSEMSALTLVFGIVLFTFQLYCDFSGYSNIAIGTAKLFGFDLTQNFAFPFFARDIAEFWRKWHITLNTWFRDYIFYELGGSRSSKMKIARNTIIIFVISGIWHGANWTYIITGLLHGLYFLPFILMRKHRRYTKPIPNKQLLPKGKELLAMLKVFGIFSFSMVFFRSETINDAFSYLEGIVNLGNLYNGADWLKLEFFNTNTLYVFGSLLFLIVIEWYNRNSQFGLEKISNHVVVRWVLYLLMSLIMIQYFAAGSEFIYFQF